MGLRSEKKSSANPPVDDDPGEASAEADDAAPKKAPHPFLGVASAKIHGEGRLDFVLDFVAFVAKPMPLSLLLDEAPRRIAAIVGGLYDVRTGTVELLEDAGPGVARASQAAATAAAAA